MAASTTATDPSDDNPIVRLYKRYLTLPTPWEMYGTTVAWIGAGVMLLARFFLALPFWNAGQARLENWGSQAFLFEYEHPLPLLSPGQAAVITTAAELVLPVLLILGLFGRLAGLGLGIMAATIFFVIGGAYAIAAEQVPWMLVGLAILLLGPGRLSADYWIGRFLR